MSTNSDLILVSTSSGLDSTMSLCILQLAGYKNILAVFYRYGARSQDSEELAIRKITSELKIPLKIFDLSSIYKEMDVESISMLANEKSDIITGTEKGLKSVAAWHPARNLLFMNLMIALGEAEIMKHNYEKVYLCAGWNLLTESATYPDNTSYFSDACLNAAKYGTLVGNRFKILYCLSNLMKFEEFSLIKHFGLENIYHWTISCDRAKVVNGIPCNCMKNGKPACGSGALASWGAHIALGQDDTKLRNYYEIPDSELYDAYRPSHMNSMITKEIDIHNIIDRILLPPERLKILHQLASVKEKSKTW